VKIFQKISVKEAREIFGVKEQPGENKKAK